MLDKILTYRFMKSFDRFVNRAAFVFYMAFIASYWILHTRWMAETLVVGFGIHMLMQIGYTVLSGPTMKRERKRQLAEAQAELARKEAEEMELFRQGRRWCNHG